MPAGHDRFSGEQAYRILGAERAGMLERFGCFHDGLLNMTYVALRFSRFVNGVAMQHGKVSRQMFPDYTIDAITNGVHAGTWTAPSVQALFDQHLPRWRQDNVTLRYAIDIPEKEIVEAPCRVQAGAHRDGEGGYRRGDEAGRLHPRLRAPRCHLQARRSALYRSRAAGARSREKFGGMQIVYAGKAHPADEPGKAKIRRVIELAKELRESPLQVVYLENYEWNLGALLTGGVDLWLNTPRRPYEASGTSGMKAALNGVPSLSILDGWWIEGWIEGVTGWAIDDHDDEPGEAKSLYEHLEKLILPLYLQGHGAVAAHHALDHRAQRIVLQHAAHARAVRHQCVLSGEARGEAAESPQPELENSVAG